MKKSPQSPPLPEVGAEIPHGGNTHSFCRNITLWNSTAASALGTWGGGHPFDVQIRRIPPGAAECCPFRSHMGQWEMFVVQAGTGTVRSGPETHAIKPGDVFVHPPATPHQLINSGTVDLVVLIVADNPSLDACFYPDSNKWSLRPPGKIFRMTETTYFDGEEEPDRESRRLISPPPVTAPEFIPFAKRKVHLDDLKWEPWSSPKGKFSATSKELSIAVGALRNTPTGLGGHPFDLELGRIAPGLTGCPFHSHSSQWELYIISHRHRHGPRQRRNRHRVGRATLSSIRPARPTSSSIRGQSIWTTSSSPTIPRNEFLALPRFQ